MNNKQFKKYKLKKLQKIKQSFKYMYIFRYNNLKTNEMLSIKKKIKELNYNSLVLNQNLIKNIYSNIKGQGSILIIYGNENKNIFKKLIIFQKLEFLFLILEKNIYSKIKIKKINLNDNPLNLLIINPFLVFLYLLRKTQNKANIT